MNFHPALIFLLTLLPLGAQAQQEGLGRLFLTPEQRQALDRQRLLNPGNLDIPDDDGGSLTINGEVRRSSGRTTRWINGEAEWNPSRQRPPVAVGDTFYPGTGEREGVLRGGKIVVKPAPPGQ